MCNYLEEKRARINPLYTDGGKRVAIDAGNIRKNTEIGPSIHADKLVEYIIVSMHLELVSFSHLHVGIYIGNVKGPCVFFWIFSACELSLGYMGNSSRLRPMMLRLPNVTRSISDGKFRLILKSPHHHPSQPATVMKRRL